MQFEVTATCPRGTDPAWLEASECAESLDDALEIIKQWAEAGEIEPYSRARVSFHINTTPGPHPDAYQGVGKAPQD